LLFYSTHPHPPSSTLFPYTTLFRSGVNVQVHGDIVKSAQMSVEANLGTSSNTSRVDYTGKLDGKLSIQEKGGPSWDWIESTVNLDRKSTRLNSSHLVISYAVFCLKK